MRVRVRRVVDLGIVDDLLESNNLEARTAHLVSEGLSLRQLPLL